VSSFTPVMPFLIIILSLILTPTDSLGYLVSHIPRKGVPHVQNFPDEPTVPQGRSSLLFQPQHHVPPWRFGGHPTPPRQARRVLESQQRRARQGDTQRRQGPAVGWLRWSVGCRSCIQVDRLGAHEWLQRGCEQSVLTKALHGGPTLPSRDGLAAVKRKEIKAAFQTGQGMRIIDQLEAANDDLGNRFGGEIGIWF